MIIGLSSHVYVQDYYDGLLDITHAADYITISNVYFHDHWKGSLIGHSDNNGAEDIGTLRVTYYQCHFQNVYSRGPSLRFGTGNQTIPHLKSKNFITETY